jgi:uncharacterized phiE125 gp8 family phage protein
MSWKVTVGPILEPVTVEEAKRHLRILDDDTQNEDIADVIKDARDWCENYIDLAILEQTITLKLDTFPAKDFITLPRSNLISITSVKYTDPDGIEQTVSTSVYAADTYGRPGHVFLKDGQEWPSSLADQKNAVEVIYKAGYGNTRDSVPPAIKRAIKLLLSHWDSNREATIVGVSVAELPMGVTAALDKHRLYGL